MHKAIAVLIAAIMVIGLLPLSALASDENGDEYCGVGPYVATQTEDEHDIVADSPYGNYKGRIEYNAESGANPVIFAELEKWAEYVSGTDNVFDITLQVTGNKIEPPPRPVYTVIVTDLSGSMTRNYIHTNSNTRQGDLPALGYRTSSTTCTTADTGLTSSASSAHDYNRNSNPNPLYDYTRLQQVQDASYKLIDDLLGAHTDNRIALASFGTAGAQDQGFTNTASDLKSVIKSYCDKNASNVWSIKQPGGNSTNHEAGLIAAYKYIDAAMENQSIKEQDPVFVILFMSDGSTQRRLTTNTTYTRAQLIDQNHASNGSASTSSASAVAAATAIKGSGTDYPVIIYGVSVGNGDIRPASNGAGGASDIPSPGFLNSIATGGSSGVFETNASADSVQKIYEQVGKAMDNPTIDTNAVITDIIPAGFTVRSAEAYGLDGNKISSGASISTVVNSDGTTTVTWSGLPAIGKEQSVKLVIRVEAPVTCENRTGPHGLRDTNVGATLTYTNITNPNTTPWVAVFKVPSVHVPKRIQPATVYFVKALELDGTPSADPTFTFELYNGEELVKYGTLDAAGTGSIAFTAAELNTLLDGASSITLTLKEKQDKPDGRWTYSDVVITVVITEAGEVTYYNGQTLLAEYPVFTNSYKDYYTVTVNHYINGVQLRTEVVLTNLLDDDPYNAAYRVWRTFRGAEFLYGVHSDDSGNIMTTPADARDSADSQIKGKDVIIDLYYVKSGDINIHLTKTIQKERDMTYPDTYEFVFTLYYVNKDDTKVDVASLTFNQNDFFTGSVRNVKQGTFVWNLPDGVSFLDLLGKQLFLTETYNGNWSSNIPANQYHYATIVANANSGAWEVQYEGSRIVRNTYNQQSNNVTITLDKSFIGDPDLFNYQAYDNSALVCHVHGEDCWECTVPTHTHDDECYAWAPVLDCEEDHEHDDDCYILEKGELECLTPEHVHGDGNCNMVAICGEVQHGDDEHSLGCYEYTFRFQLTRQDGTPVGAPQEIVLTAQDIMDIFNGDATPELLGKLRLTFTIGSGLFDSARIWQWVEFRIVESFGDDYTGWNLPNSVRIFVNRWGEVRGDTTRSVINPFEVDPPESFKIGKTLIGNIYETFTFGVWEDVAEDVAVDPAYTLTINGAGEVTVELDRYINIEQVILKVAEIAGTTVGMDYDDTYYILVVEYGKITSVTKYSVDDIDPNYWNSESAPELVLEFENTFVTPIIPDFTITKETDREGTFYFDLYYYYGEEYIKFDTVSIMISEGDNGAGQCPVDLEDYKDSFIGFEVRNFTGTIKIVEVNPGEGWYCDIPEQFLSFVNGVWYNQTGGDNADDGAIVQFINHHSEPSVLLEKKVSAERVLVGSTVNYTLLATNTGNENLYGVFFTDSWFSAAQNLKVVYDGVELTEGVDYEFDATDANRINLYKIIDESVYETFEVGKSFIITYSLSFNETGTMVNEARVTGFGMNEKDPVYFDDSASVEVYRNNRPGDPDYGTLVVTKQFSGVTNIPSNWSATVTLTGPNGYSQSRTITAANRTATFGNLNAGTYTVSETNASGIADYTFVGVTGDGAHSVSLNRTTNVTITNEYSSGNIGGAQPDDGTTDLLDDGPPLAEPPLAAPPPEEEDELLLEEDLPPLGDMPQTGDDSTDSLFPLLGLSLSMMLAGGLSFKIMDVKKRSK